jgi:uncharacterized membrane protein
MNGIYPAARMGIRITGTLLIILGIILWTGNADGLKGIHILIGLLLIICLWILAYGGARNGADTWLVVTAVIWGFITPALGLAQENIATGSGHWVIQVVHLLVGIAAIGLGERLGAAIARQDTLAPAAA